MLPYSELEYGGIVQKMKKHFEIVRIVKPKASRAKSSEIFLFDNLP